MENNKNKDNKFKLYEIVKVVNDRKYSGFSNDREGFIHQIYDGEQDKDTEYDILMFEWGVRSSKGENSIHVKSTFQESEMESTGYFLPPDEMNERMRRDAIENKFKLWEIVNVIDDREGNIVNKHGFVYDMDKDYRRGEWGYGVATIENDTKYWTYEHHFGKVEGKMLSDEEIEAYHKREEERQAELDRVDPLTWEEKNRMEELLEKAKEDAEINGDNVYNIRIRAGHELNAHVHNKESKAYIAYRAETIYDRFVEELENSDVLDILYSLRLMSDAPEMEFGYRELDEVSKALIFGEDLSRWT
ncbi:MAG: hypothetical protein EOP45_09345 [Sphingobacteriaceae bacterium]|nr:MAG: hypothetical protein EOP45_09345 [Sphingobacteriaceae bacterium]